MKNTMKEKKMTLEKVDMDEISMQTKKYRKKRNSNKNMFWTKN